MKLAWEFLVYPFMIVVGVSAGVSIGYIIWNLALETADKITDKIRWG